MSLEVVKMNGYNANLLKTNKYSVYAASFAFELEYTRYNVFLAKLLSKYLFNINSKYKSREKISQAFKENYNMDVYISVYDRGDKLFFELNLNLLDPRKLKDEYLDSALKLAHDLFFDIYKEGMKLNKKTLRLIIDNSVCSVASDLSNPAYKSHILFEKEVYKDSKYMIEHIDTKEEFEDILNSYSDSEIIKMHEYIINNCFVGCFLLGNYRKKDLQLFKKYFPLKYHKPNTKYKYYISLDNVPSYIEHTDETISTTYLNVVYKIDDYKYNDFFVFNAINASLNSTGMLLHKVLREEYRLVYSANSCLLTKSGIYEISAEIDASNEDKVVKAIDEVFNRLKNKKTIKELLIKGKKEVKLSNYVEDESYARVFSRIIDEHYKFCDKKNTLTRKYMVLNEEDIINAIDRIKKVTVFVYRGNKS